MLTVACVKWGRKYSAEYVNILHAMVARNLKREYRFICFTDDPKKIKCETQLLPSGLWGWWNKLWLFSPGLFPGKLLFLDLDVVVTGSLDELVDYASPFAIISDWHLDSYNSSVFTLDRDEETQVWTDFIPAVVNRLPGDQDWITEKVPNAAIFPAQWCVSYRSHAVPGVPRGAKVVVMHGDPKPKEIGGWVKEYWHE